MKFFCVLYNYVDFSNHGDLMSTLTFMKCDFSPFTFAFFNSYQDFPVDVN